jgi:hypothetical protein
LNEITQAKYMSLLPLSITGVTWSELLRTYQEYQGSDYDPVELHSALQWRSGDAPKIPAIPIVGQWSLVGKDLKPAIPTKFRMTLHLCPLNTNVKIREQTTKKSCLQDVVKPSATLWDRVNYSCAYDTLFSILYDVCRLDPPLTDTLFVVLYI